MATMLRRINGSAPQPFVYDVNCVMGHARLEHDFAHEHEHGGGSQSKSEKGAKYLKGDLFRSPFQGCANILGMEGVRVCAQFFQEVDMGR